MTEYYFDTSASAAISQIKSTLENMAHDIETFHHSGNNAMIVNSVQNLEQISGTLTFLGFYGGVELCNQMIDSLSYLSSAPITESGKAIEILITSTFLLDKYIDYVFSSKRDNKVLVLDIVNLLKDCSGKKPLPEFKFAYSPFLHRSEWPAKSDAPKKISAKSQALLKKVQHVYQVGLLGIIKSSSSEQHVKLMVQAISKAYKMTQRFACGEYWLLARCLIDVIYKKQIEIDSSLKALLASINLEFSYLKNYNSQKLDEKPSDEKIFGLYYYLIKSGTDNKTIESICKRFVPTAPIYSADETAADKSVLDTPDSSVMSKVSAEIEEQLDIVRDKLLTLYSEKDLDDDVLAELREGLFNINSTLSLLGLNDAASAVHDIDDDLCAIISGTESNFESAIASAADSIEAADAMIKGFGQKSQSSESIPANNSYYNEALDILIKESRSNMSKVKSEMEEYMDSCMDSSHISLSPSLLDEIHGALFIIEFEQAASIISTCNNYINSNIIDSNSVPRPTDIDNLTDSLAGIEWYLEGFGEFRQRNEGLLDMASKSLESLEV